MARRISWVEDYTPVNEPLTTARFSLSLWSLVSTQTRRAVVFESAVGSMPRNYARDAAIRTFNPRARLIQTEDLARTYSTRPLAYQAEFENERRWLTFDLLSGDFQSPQTHVGNTSVTSA